MEEDRRLSWIKEVGNSSIISSRLLVKKDTTIYVQTVCLQTKMSKTELQYTN